VAAFWFVLVGVLLVAVALLGRFLDRLPISLAMIYLTVGFLLGPAVFNVLELHPLRELTMLESITEIALLIALFTVGIKMRVPIGDWRWSLPLRLATVTMVVTILGIAIAAMIILDFEWPLALVIGAVLAPTDPVLASDVQLRSAQDRDSLRFGITAEGGLNDGTAYPFVLLGLGALGLHDLGFMGWRWLAIDLVWSTVAGLGIGFLVGAGLAGAVRLLRAWRKDAVIFDEFLLLGVIALSYGVALAAHALGFLAVFAAGLALRRADELHAGSTRAADNSPLTPSMLSVNVQLERIVEVAIVLLVGAMISTGYWSMPGLVLGGVLMLVIRPLAVWIGVRGTDSPPRRLLAWFGVRGIGSVYYAVYFAGFELRDAVATELLSAVFTVIALSIVLHGISATPLMKLYKARRSASQRRDIPVSDK
jgi:NhaP-type Na+/H+ or K+/H+ antiporter